MLGVERFHYRHHFDITSSDHAGSLLTVDVEWSVYATDAQEQTARDVTWRWSFYGLSMRRPKRSSSELRALVLEALGRHFEPSDERWSRLAISVGEDRKVDEYDILVRYRTKMSSSHLEAVHNLVESIVGMLEGILEDHGILPRTA